jgi:hypothetical protein
MSNILQLFKFFTGTMRLIPYAETRPEDKLTISLGVATSSADLSEAVDSMDKTDRIFRITCFAGEADAGKNPGRGL